MSDYAIAFSFEDGSSKFYTGKAGVDYLSDRIEDAFFAYSIDGVRRIGSKMYVAGKVGCLAVHWKGYTIEIDNKG